MNPDCPRCGAGCSIKYGRYRRAEDAQKMRRKFNDISAVSAKNCIPARLIAPRTVRNDGG